MCKKTKHVEGPEWARDILEEMYHVNRMADGVNESYGNLRSILQRSMFHILASADTKYIDGYNRVLDALHIKAVEYETKFNEICERLKTLYEAHGAWFERPFNSIYINLTSCFGDSEYLTLDKLHDYGHLIDGKMVIYDV